ncbi:hypothetical protein LTR37_019640 [Vermiconidia calcicola]|uniref:Uncharacterized protein n=1 Tax=Vermiconidia calcicola TaxID=1690605 RepID=A0ACC3MDH4_9PEZI|nr:hypothetical protein LTR37_019640 [Vermiconidia calcicola]
MAQGPQYYHLEGLHEPWRRLFRLTICIRVDRNVDETSFDRAQAWYSHMQHRMRLGLDEWMEGAEERLKRAQYESARYKYGGKPSKRYGEPEETQRKRRKLIEEGERDVMDGFDVYGNPDQDYMDCLEALHGWKS